ncbi:MAG: hypothetical protein IPK23_10310 [Rhizobiales bacterium]|nr:hypothetical protein [Hyphomicrobiales bacterium]
MSREARDVPNVIARPPLILFVTLVAGLVLDQLYPAGHIGQMATVCVISRRHRAFLMRRIALLGTAAERNAQSQDQHPDLGADARARDGRRLRHLTRNPIYLAFIFS